MTPPPLRQDLPTIGLVGLAHASSHFFHLLLPSLFPWFIRDFGLSYSQLGLLATLFFVISGVGQASAGFLVDRVGARPVLFAAVSCFVAAALAAASAQGYWGLMLAAALAGLGNAPFHPVGFTILNARVSPVRLGHAYSVHGISGNLGWAAAPVVLTGLTALSGSWRLAYLVAAAGALMLLALLVWQREALDDRLASRRQARSASVQGHSASVAEHPLAFLKLPSVWLCFSFFFWTMCTLSAIQSFASPALQTLYGLPLESAAMVVTGFMLFGAAGMAAGGFLAARARHLERIVAVCLLLSAALLLAVGFGALPGSLALVLAMMAGLGNGLAGPSRDLLIKSATPPGASGRVYGTVYSGMDVGSAIAAPVYGALLDRGLADGVFYGAAAALLMAVLSATLVGLRLQRHRAPFAKAPA